MAYNIEGKPLTDDADRFGASRPPRDLLASIASDANGRDAARNAAEVISHPNGGAIGTVPVGGPLKRAFDIAAALCIILLTLPLILATTLLAALLGGGPMLYAHTRVGFRGKEFQCLKFRTMVVDSEQRLAEYLASNPAAAEQWLQDRKLRDDPRVTWVGKILRKTSLDELPQLLNVVRGDMSLVGPRPIVADELPRYGARRAAYLSARPGMTGLWQVSGRNNTTYDRRTELDESYVKNWTLVGDIGIILRTVPEMLPSSRAS
ncbi:MAG: sugar transferase [Caulobacterales bacterium]